MSDLPKVIASAEIDLGGFIMHVHNLDNGQRVIDADDFERFFGDPNIKITEDQARLLAQEISKPKSKKS